MCISICFNSVCDTFFNCFVLIKSSGEGFIAAYLFSFIFTIYAFLKQSLLELYINLLSSLSMFSEIFGLFFSKSEGLLLVEL